MLSEPFGLEPLGHELEAEWLMAERLRVEDNYRDYSDESTLWYLRIEALSFPYAYIPRCRKQKLLLTKNVGFAQNY